MQDGKYVILCVDDDPDVLDAARIILESNGYIFESAESAEEGMKMYKEKKPDLLIVDLMMEEVDAGTAFVKNLKAEGNAAPVYMLSSVGDALNMNIDTTELGLSGVFQKPLKAEVILPAIKAKLK